MDGAERPSLLVFADDWGRHPSSCQHLVRRLQDRWRILWVNTVGTRQVRVDGFTCRRGWEKLRGWSSGLRQVAETMWVLDPPMLPAAANSVWRTVNRTLVTRRIRGVLRRLGMCDPVVLTTLPYTVWLLGNLGQRGLVYNCTDDYSYWPSADRDTLQQAEAEIRRRADVVLAASRRLQQLHRQAARCEYFPHAVDFDHFASAAGSRALPAQLQQIPNPRVGFFGLIYEKLDFELLTAVVTELPQVNLVLIGPCDYRPAEFALLPRVHFVGPKAYDELPAWIAGLDVLLLPYVDDEMIRQSNPLKLRECLATGKPTVSIDIAEVRQFEPHVRVAASRQDFVAAVRQTLNGQADKTTVVQRQQSVRQESWEARAQQLHDWLALFATPSFMEGR
jgi:glycosyltransferase involved in cell wall biosynthesis